MRLGPSVARVSPALSPSQGTSTSLERRARMLVSFFLRGCLAMAESVRCSVQGCEDPAASSLEVHSFCREHFISTCYEQLEQCRNWQEARLSPDRTSESVRQFLGECCRQVAQLASNVKEFTGLEWAQLLDILLRATDLSRQLRQNPRLAASTAVELRCEEPGGAWEEETQTKQISRYGALLKCQHPVRAGEILLVVRLDTGRQVCWKRKRTAFSRITRFT